MKPFFRFQTMRVAFIFLIGVLLAAACSPASTGAQKTAPAKATTQAPVDATPSEFPTPYENQIPAPGAAGAAQQLLAKRLGVTVDQVTIREIEQEQWSDACLGLQHPDEACAAVITDGYRVVLGANGKIYEAHTDLDGTQVRFVEDYGKGLPQRITPQPGDGSDDGSGGGLPDGDTSEIAEKVRQALSAKAGIALNQIQVVSVEPVEWPDGCLGIRTRGVACVAVITPGYLVLLEANGQTFEFHTDTQANAILQAGAPRVEIMDAELVWEQTAEGSCSQLTLSGSTVSSGLCGKSNKDTTLSPNRLKELAYFESMYKSFSAETKSGKVTFTGSGTQQASEAEQRSVAEWARLVYQEAQKGSSGSSGGLAVVWHREGGIAGFCNDLSMYLTGWAQPGTCKAGQVKNLDPYRLKSADLEQLYAWMDELENFEYEQKDPAAADAMTIKMVFIGDGGAQASPDQQEQMAAFASSIYTVAARQGAK